MEITNPLSDASTAAPCQTPPDAIAYPHASATCPDPTAMLNPLSDASTAAPRTTPPDVIGYPDASATCADPTAIASPASPSCDTCPCVASTPSKDVSICTNYILSATVALGFRPPPTPTHPAYPILPPIPTHLPDDHHSSPIPNDHSLSSPLPHEHSSSSSLISIPIYPSPSYSAMEGVIAEGLMTSKGSGTADHACIHPDFVPTINPLVTVEPGPGFRFPPHMSSLPPSRRDPEGGPSHEEMVNLALNALERARSRADMEGLEIPEEATDPDLQPGPPPKSFRQKKLLKPSSLVKAAEILKAKRKNGATTSGKAKGVPSHLKDSIILELEATSTKKV